MQQPRNDIQQQIQNSGTLQIIAKSIVNQFDNLYVHLDKLKQKATDKHQIQQLSNVQYQIVNLATKTLDQSQQLKSTTKRNDVQEQILNLKKQLEILQKRHLQLQSKHDQLDRRVTELQCTLVTRQQFQQLKQTCVQKFSMFDNRFRVMQQENKKLSIYIDDQFKKKIMPNEEFKIKLSQLMKTNYRMFQYAKKLYWSIINQILAYRAISTGMIQKGKITSGIRQTQLFKQFVNVVNTATYLIAGIPFAGGIFLVIKDLSSLFFNKQEQVLIYNMRLRIQGYFTQDQISQDVATAVLQLISNPNLQKRVLQFKTKAAILSCLCKFFTFISTTQFSAQTLADIFTSKLSNIKKQKQNSDSDYITENVATDTALIMWKMAQSSPSQKRRPVTGAVRALFKKQQHAYQVQNLSTPNTPKTQQNQNQYFCNTGNSQSSGKQHSFIIHNQFNEQIPPLATQNIKHTAINQNVTQKVKCMSQNYNFSRLPYFKLKIIRGDLSLKKQYFLKANPYCIVKYRDKVFKTQPHKTADMKPIWNQQFLFQSSQIPSTITIQVFDKQRLLKDGILGNANILDTQFSKSQQQIQLWDQGKPAGKIYIILQP